MNPAAKAILMDLIFALTGTPDAVRTLPQPVVFEVRAGERVVDFLKRVEELGWMTAQHMAAAVRTYDFSVYPFVTRRVSGLRKLEGIFVPGVYELYQPSPDGVENARLLLDMLLDRASQRFAGMRTVEGLSPYEQMTLASVVEKEAAFQTQYKEVAGTFWNRVRAFQRNGAAKLESCATVEYVLGYHKPFLRRPDLEAVADSPYNTYYHPGLMPTPICFVSDEALAAVESPLQTDYYFLVMDWMEGNIRFNVRYADHQRDVEDIISKIQRNYGSLVFKRMDGYYYNYFATTGRRVSN